MEGQHGVAEAQGQFLSWPAPAAVPSSIEVDQVHARTHGDASRIRVAYLTNQYPAPSHSFIRREIVALEARGNTVLRYALNYRQDELVGRVISPRRSRPAMFSGSRRPGFSQRCHEPSSDTRAAR
jgi:hypothetical protein